MGAPPDMFSPAGQDWTQPPWNPLTLAEAGTGLSATSCDSSCGTRGLRIDHVIGMFRLWWIPPGAPATDGTYVRSDHQRSLTSCAWKPSGPA